MLRARRVLRALLIQSPFLAYQVPGMCLWSLDALYPQSTTTTPVVPACTLGTCRKSTTTANDNDNNETRKKYKSVVSGTVPGTKHHTQPFATTTSAASPTPYRIPAPLLQQCSVPFFVVRSQPYAQGQYCSCRITPRPKKPRQRFVNTNTTNGGNNVRQPLQRECRQGWQRRRHRQPDGRRALDLQQMQPKQREEARRLPPLPSSSPARNGRHRRRRATHLRQPFSALYPARKYHQHHYC